MSLNKLTELQDVKDIEKALIDERVAKFKLHRSQSLINLLNEMKAHLMSQGFEIELHSGPSRGFTANYKGLLINVLSSKDDEQFFGADYAIDLTSGKVKGQVTLSVGRNDGVEPPSKGDVDKQIDDYKSRYIPALREKANEPFNLNHRIELKMPDASPKVALKNGAEAIDRFSEKLI
jgi:hypothetical protein